MGGSAPSPGAGTSATRAERGTLSLKALDKETKDNALGHESTPILLSSASPRAGMPSQENTEYPHS